MSAAVFLPDPLLSRAIPAASDGGFNAEALRSEEHTSELQSP